MFFFYLLHIHSFLTDIHASKIAGNIVPKSHVIHHSAVLSVVAVVGFIAAPSAGAPIVSHPGSFPGDIGVAKKSFAQTK